MSEVRLYRADKTTPPSSFGESRRRVVMKMETDYSYKNGSILMDAPVKHDMEKLVEAANCQRQGGMASLCKRAQKGSV